MFCLFVYAKAAIKALPVMTRNTRAALTVLASVFVVSVGVACADEPVPVSIAIKDHQFEPAEVHAPPGKPIAITIKNLDSIAAEFESDALHIEKVVPPGREAVVRVRPLEPGRYNFFDDFHRATQGFLVVP
jgi:heme/copper-type cytochrome/quinol oxidase subunit 2